MTKRILSLALVLALILVAALPMAATAADSDTTLITAEVGNTPTVTSVSPNTANVNTTPSITITGTDFIDGQTTVNLDGTGVTAGAVTFVSASEITVTFTVASDALAGQRHVTVTVYGKTSVEDIHFTVNPFITINSPATIDIGKLTAGATKTGSSVLTNLVSTNSSSWTVAVSDADTGKAANQGHMVTGGSTPLTASFAINKTASDYQPAETGFSFTQADTTSPTLYYSQVVASNAAAGTYSITITFAGSTP